MVATCYESSRREEIVGLEIRQDSYSRLPSLGWGAGEIRREIGVTSSPSDAGNLLLKIAAFKENIDAEKAATLANAK